MSTVVHECVLQFLEEYLSSYVVPPAVKINDPTWKEFFSEVVSRYSALSLNSNSVSVVLSLSLFGIQVHW